LHIHSGAGLGLAWCGVDLFFVLSGFLITGILIDTKGTPQAWRNFYVRRMLRIFPLYYLTLLVYFQVMPAAARLASRLPNFEPTEQAYYWLYLSNWSPSLGMAHKLLTHLWSLSVEEQFYVLWPVLVFTQSRRCLGFLCAATIVVAPCIRLAYLLMAGDPGPAVYRGTLCRVDTLAFGAVCALLWRDPVLFRRAMGWRPAVLALAAVGLAVNIASGGAAFDHLPINAIGYTSVAILFGYLILWAAEGGAGLRAVLRFGALRSIGKYSYAMYLFHVPIVAMLGGVHGMTAFATTVAISYAAGAISWRMFESRCLQLKSRFEYRATPQTVRALGASA
jgi:peptidoglycan/LPS O-acetylase OafA/YrhL